MLTPPNCAGGQAAAVGPTSLLLWGKFSSLTSTIKKKRHFTYLRSALQCAKLPFINKFTCEFTYKNHGTTDVKR
jgi:hypothetical protein